MSYWIETDEGRRIAGPFTTQLDALKARYWVERVLKPQTFWVRERKDEGSDE